MSASASSSSLESLIHAIIPQSRNDKSLFNDIHSHCKDVLSRLAIALFCPSFSRRDNLKLQPYRPKPREGYGPSVRHRQASAYVYPRFPVPLPNARPVSVSQSHPDGVLSVQFANLFSRLLEQVPFSPNDCVAS